MDKKEIKDKLNVYGNIFKEKIFKFSKQAQNNLNDWGKIGQDKISIKILESKIEKKIFEIGKYVLEQSVKKRKDIKINDKEISGLLSDIAKLKRQIEQKEKDIEKIKKDLTKIIPDNNKNIGLKKKKKSNKSYEIKKKNNEKKTNRKKS